MFQNGCGIPGPESKNRGRKQGNPLFLAGIKGVFYIYKPSFQSFQKPVKSETGDITTPGYANYY
jgi:hypothetical protein